MMMENEHPAAQPLILLVDDSPTTVRVLEDALRDQYAIESTLSGEAALERMQQEPLPDLVLLDLMMPGMDGYEVCRRLQGDERTKETPIIVITGDDEEDAETRALEVGAIDFIRKPLSLPVVQARMRTHMALKRAREDLRFQYQELCKAAKMRDDIERMTRHDLKTPLLTIVRETQHLMQDPLLNQTQRERAFVAQAAGYSVINMINLSLDLYKMETGRYVLDLQPVDLAPLIDRAFLEFQALTAEKRVDYNLSVLSKSSKLPPSFEVLGDALLLYTACSKMIKCVIEASPPGTTIAIELDKVAGARYVVRIRAQGTALDAVKAGLFQNADVCALGEGGGLEGYAARLIVETHGGEIALTESEDGASCISITLPHRSGDTAT